MEVTPLRITGSAPPGSPFQTVWWPTRTPGTSVMALWVPVGRKPTGIPKSRALPLALGGLDTGGRLKLLQFELRVDLDVPVAIAARADERVVVDQAGHEDPGHEQQVADLLLAKGDRHADQPDDGRRRPERHLPRPRQIFLGEAADNRRDADQAVEDDQQHGGKRDHRDQGALEREDGSQCADDQGCHPGCAVARLDLPNPLTDGARPGTVAAGGPDDTGELQGDRQRGIEDGDDRPDGHDVVEGRAERVLGRVEERRLRGDEIGDVRDAEEYQEEGADLERDTNRGGHYDGPADVLGLAFGLLREVDGAVVAIDREHGDGDRRDDEAQTDMSQAALVAPHPLGEERK